MIFSSNAWMRGSLRSSHSLRHNIRTNNSRLFMENRFFHSQNCIRPSLQSQALKRPSPRNLFWCYLNAPGNMLFLTTNFIGLGILVTYRCLYTIANADRMSHNDQNIHADIYKKGLIEFGRTGEDRFDLLKRQLQQQALEEEELELAALEKELEYEEMTEEELRDFEDQDTEGTAEMMSFKEADEDLELPLTEMDLDEYGPPITRDLKEERFKTLLVNQLLSVHYINDFLSQVFLTDTPNMELLESLSREAKEGLIVTLYDILLRQNNGEAPIVNTFDDFFKKLPLKEVDHFIRHNFVSDLKHQLVRYNDASLKDEVLENLPTKTNLEVHNSQSVQNALNKEYDLDSDMYLELATTLVNSHTLATKPTSTMYQQFIEQYNSVNNVRKNKNLKNLASILNSLYFHTGVYHNEKFFNQLMKSAITLQNTRAFHEGLRHLNIDESSLGISNKLTSKKVRKLGSKGDDHGYQFSINSYRIAIEGLLKFKSSKNHVQAAVNKVLKGLSDSGDELKVSFNNRIKVIGSQTLYSKIPVELFELFVMIAKEYKDNIFLSWCFQFLNKHYDVSSTVYSHLYKCLKDTAESLGNKELSQKIDEVYNNKH